MGVQLNGLWNGCSVGRGNEAFNLGTTRVQLPSVSQVEARAVSSPFPGWVFVTEALLPGRVPLYALSAGLDFGCKPIVTGFDS